MHYFAQGATLPPAGTLPRSRATSLAIAILIVDADEAAAEGQYFAKGDEDGVMYLCQWRTAEARQQHRAPEGAERNCRCQLKIFHIPSRKFCRLCRGCVALRGCVLLLQEVVSALPRLCRCARLCLAVARGCAPSAGCVRSAQVTAA